MYIDADADEAAARAVVLLLARTEFVNTSSHETDLIWGKEGKKGGESNLPNWWSLKGSETKSDDDDDGGGGGDATKVNGVKDNGFSLVAKGEIFGRVLWSKRS